jgi:hypothetical protein
MDREKECYKGIKEEHKASMTPESCRGRWYRHILTVSLQVFSR